MDINEIFLSIQGEGIYTGIPMVFIRTEYCNLRCSWCDTKYSFYEGKSMEINEILGTVKKNKGVKWICITGGEPLLQRDLSELVNSLSGDYNILLETSGSLDIKRFLPEYKNVKKDIDFKLPSSGMYGKFNYKNTDYMNGEDYIKFVVSDELDLNTALKETKKIGSGIKYIIQPAYGSKMLQLANKYLLMGFENSRFMLQEHKYIFGDIRGV